MLLRLMAFIRLGRFPFLVGGFVLYGLGVAIAYHEGFKLNGQVFVVGQIIVTATQLMVHYSNDYFDQVADQVNLTPTAWSGGSRVLPAKQLPPRVAIITAGGMGLTALMGALWLVLTHQVGPVGLLMVLSAIILAWFYSAPPIQLHMHGLGEICATLVLTVLTPLIGFHLQAKQFTLLPFLAIIPLCFLQFNMLISVAIPDAESDRKVNKRTLVVILGPTTSARLYMLGLGLAYGSLPLLVLISLPAQVATAFAFSFPVALWLGWLIWRGAWFHPKYWSCIALLGIIILLSSAIFEITAFLKFTV